MKNKKYFKLMGIMIMISIMIISIGLVKSDTHIQDITIEELGGGVQKFIFSGPNPEVTINGKTYKNIVPGQSYIVWDGKKIIELNIIVNEKGGVYFFGENEINAPPNSLVLYDNKPKFVLEELNDMITIKLQKDSKIESPPILVDSVVKFICFEDCILPNGAVITGTVYYDKDGLVMDSQSVPLEINGAQVFSTERPASILFSEAEKEVHIKKFPTKRYILMGSDGKIEGVHFISIDTGKGIKLNPSAGGRVTFEIGEDGIPSITGEAPFVIEINNGKEILSISSVYNKELDKDEVRITKRDFEASSENNLPNSYDKINLEFYDNNILYMGIRFN